MNATSPASDQPTQSRAYLQSVFSDRPSLEDVANTLLQEALTERFASQALNPRTLAIGQTVTLATEGDTTGYRHVRSVADALIERVMQGKAVNYTLGQHVVLQTGRQTHSPVSTGLTVDDLEQVINQLGPFLVGRFQERLAGYWSECPALIDPVSTRWRIVSEQLRRSLRNAPQNPPLSTAQAQSLLGNLYSVQADRDKFTGPDTLRISLIYAVSGAGSGEWLTVLVLQRWLAGKHHYYLYSPGTSLLSLDSLKDLERLLPRHMSRHHPGENIRWTMLEPDNDVFDRLAQSLLEKQLRDLADIRWSTFPSVEYYKQLLNALTAPEAWFSSPTRQPYTPGEDTLPLWLQTAQPDVRQLYSQWLEDLAKVERESAGASYLDGLDTITVYARKALQAQMAEDYPQEVVIDPDQYALAFTRTQGGTVGWTQTTQRSLTEWALENPFASPYARVEIKNLKQPGYVPDWWIKIPYLKRLIQRVDIGKYYPVLLEQKLISDESEAQRRRRLFCDHARVQLPLLALENMQRGHWGFTLAGFKTLCTLLHPQAAASLPAQQQPVAARPLAFLLHAGGKAHVAHNMFIIGATNAAHSPHVLYQPAGTPMLLQFASRQSLLDAIARSGTALNTAVLDSLDNSSRELFGNGGFLNPHVQRQLQGDEYDPVQASSPALLSDEQVVGDFLSHVFTQNAKALVAQAKAQSVSNDVLRWAAFRSDLWQIFNTALPLLRGPLASAGWLVQLMHSTQVLVSLRQADDEAEAGARAEFISTLAGLLLHHVATLDERLGLAQVKPHIASEQLGAVPAPQATQQSGTMLMQPAPLAEISPMYAPSWSSATALLSPALQADLATFRWRSKNAMSFQPSPAISEYAETQGPIKGLYRVFIRPQRVHLHAHIAGELYPVAAVEDGYRVADLNQPGRLGPWVKSDGDGHWSFDFRLRLSGGMPRKKSLPSRADLQRRNLELAEEYTQATSDLLKVEEGVQTTLALFERMHASEREKFTDQHRETIQRHYQEQLQKQERHQLQRMDVLRRKNENQPIARFEFELMQQLENSVENLCQQIAQKVLIRSAARPSPAVAERWFQELESDDDQVVARAHAQSIASLSSLAKLNQQLLELSLKEQTHLAELTAIPGYDPASHPLSDWTRMSWTPLDWRIKLIEVYQGLVLKRRPLPAEHEDFITTKRTLDLLIREVLSHKNLLAADELARDKRIELLGNVMDQYAVIRDRLDFVGQAYPDLFEINYFEKLIQLIVNTQGEAEHSQALLLRKKASEPPLVVAPRRPSGSRQRLIVTRDKQVLRGQVRERTPESDAEIIDVEDPIDHQKLGAFRENEKDGEWEEIPVEKPRDHAPGRAVKSLLGDADHLLAQVDRAMIDARKIAQKSNSPISVEAELTRIADSLLENAQKLRQAIGSAPANAREASRLSELEDAAKKLTEEGRQLRIEIIKRNPPEAARIQYLKDQQEIEILRVEGRIKLRRDGDYLQEYLIRDNERRPLAYAHFHYRTEDAGATVFTAGHLKRPDQRYVSFISVEGQTEQKMLTVYRSDINSRLAESLFFGTTQSTPRRGWVDYW
ncbi:hypothetical protein GIR22_22730 [Pseudomonas sp. CCM 7891]|uniref:Uncharacterized protein n=1 Tax=Pseudomonas karstica TaxID=1055468 RepID=A0A7X2RZ61_9PSED|nr:hypothetical protein [Pseudomonas karstica]MTD21950.1 hypothetical protein [Pseudomonas karstica]